MVLLRSRALLGSRRKWRSPTAPLPLYKPYSRYRMKAHWRQTYRSLPRCSGSIQCSIRSETIRASKNSHQAHRKKRTNNCRDEPEEVLRRPEATRGLELVDGLRPLNLALPPDDF